MQSTRPSTGARRLGALVGPVLLGAVVLSSCGGAESGATVSTIDLSAASTAFVVRPPASTQPPVDTDAAAADPNATVGAIQDYTVQSGDAWYVLVTRFGVSLDDLLAVNEWPDSGTTFPFPGTVIMIPPGGKSVAAVAQTAATTSASTPPAGGATDPAATTSSIPDAGDNCAPGSYTIVAGDIPIRVAKKFDVTVEALNAANAGTAGYGSFYVGLKIVIPAKADC